MTERYLRSLCHQIESDRGVLPIIGDRAEPLAAIYPADGYIDLVAALSGTEFSLQALTKKLVEAGKLKVLSVTKEEQKLFWNLNEPADLD